MIAYEARHPRKTFSEPARAALVSAVRTAIATYTADDALRAAVRVVAEDARERELGAEDVLLELKDVVAEVVSERTSMLAREDLKFREWLIAECLRAYLA